MKQSLIRNTVISHYRILSRIGAGGMGEVYLAEDTKLDRKVAIKFLPNASVSDPQAKKRLIREAQAAAKLDHSNICSIYEVSEEDGRSFIVMQYVEGETLAKLIERQPLELREALDIAVHMADALAEAHFRGIIHRDIKPQNVMVTARGQVKIEKEPNYAMAYSGLADCHTSLAFSFDVGAVSPRQTIPQAEAAARKALKIDDTLAEAHTSLAFIKLLYDWDWPGAEESFKRAIELDPNYPNAHHWYSHYLMAMGRIEESLAESRRALELDPLLLVLNLHLGWHYLYARQYDQAIEQLRKTLEMDPHFQQAHLYLGWAYLGKGMYAEAIGELQTAKALFAGGGEAEAGLGYVYAVSGKRGDALRVLIN